ncbi:CRISPR-associated protein Cas4 [Allisonella histaminiformans]|uniref:CRISPR-associated protein Cas4 n=1 Tax=Allisonella histaminiformans TaxID=209880 RepID=UPI0026EACEE8|nr:CRISPR-associated protein Cas4 [Allisonella histaminiformans]
MYDEEDWLMLSGIQHFSFCPRQWALIHIEGQWMDNLRTVEGNIVHDRAHDNNLSESRKNVLITRGLRISSSTLGVTGQCDVVEFHHVKEKGAILQGHNGYWLPYPIEYKKGKPKVYPADELQLCAEAMCLEEMLCCEIPCGALFYSEIHRREEIQFSLDLRSQVRNTVSAMHEYMKKGYTPRIKPSKHCNACSLKPICIPGNYKKWDVETYYREKLGVNQ